MKTEQQIKEMLERIRGCKKFAKQRTHLPGCKNVRVAEKVLEWVIQ